MNVPTMELYIILLLLTCLSAEGWLFKSKVCYDHYGCFDKKWPHENTNKLPQSPDKIGLGLLLNTRQSPDLMHPDFLDPNDVDTILNSRYMSSQKQLIVIIHGYRGTAYDNWVRDLLNEILLAEDVNVISVDWKNGADGMNYHQAVANSRLIAKMVSNLLQNIHTTMGTECHNMHIIGHSLGAHIAGNVGRSIPGLGRITGLDPAGPSFENYHVDVRLDPTDALFVDVIHTDDDELHEAGFGIGIPVGHVDFYPNGGEDQPGCPVKGSNILDSLKGLMDITCNHIRAAYLYTASLRKCSFVSSLCSNYSAFKQGDCTSSKTAVMGHWIDTKTEHGKYYLMTNSSEPFC